MTPPGARKVIPVVNSQGEYINQDLYNELNPSKICCIDEEEEKEIDTRESNSRDINDSALDI